MKEKIIKTLVGIESIVYLIFTVLIIVIALQNDYVSINSWTGLMLWGGMGIMCPLLASIAANVFIRREKKLVGTIISCILIPYVGVSCFSLFLFAFGGVFCSSTDNISDFRKYDMEVDEMLKIYDNVLPLKEENGICIEEYSYKYVPTFDNDCYIYIKTKYEDVQQLEEKLNIFEEKLAMKAENVSDNCGIYKYGECTINYNTSENQIEYKLNLCGGD